MRELREKISIVLRENRITVFEYIIATDHLTIYDEWMNVSKEINGYIRNLERNREIYEEDRWKIAAIYNGMLDGPEEVRMVGEDGTLRRKQIMICKLEEQDGQARRMIGSVRDITKEKLRVKQLEDMVRRDTMTGLYNYAFGKQLINDYLKQKQFSEICGMMMVDIDNFKEVNDNYGHLFGDQVLIKLAGLFKEQFRKSDILMRSGGDEFVILLKESGLSEIEKKAEELLEAAQKLQFESMNYTMKCSVGICVLQNAGEDITYDRLFRMADEALYRAKENGRNQYQSCVI